MTSTQTAADTAQIFVIARGAGSRQTWQVNGQGPRLTIRNAAARLADLCPRPVICDALGSHEAKVDFEIRGERGVVKACAFGLGWSTLEQWEIGQRALARICKR